MHSLFYYFWAAVLLGFLWMAFSLFTNSFTQFYPWTDYFGQYVTMTHYYWDCWHNFFKTGYFELYSPNTYIGSDNIGSNAYYGLFDPFLFICYLFPRVWVPQTFAVATWFKGAAGAIAMRAYLKYMGLKEETSRIGGIAFAFNGWVNYFVGFPSFVSVAFTFPMILLGIEKVIKEKKPAVLVTGLFLLGIMSFFFLVIGCIWGVIYAVWRYFWTITKRNAKDNWSVIGLGVASFAVGILLSAWTLFPSIRESALSGRTTSIGKGYLDALIAAFKGMKFKDIFGLLFQTVGRNPLREAQALQAFFYPTIGYTRLPLAGGNYYDAWTSNMFVYTPMVVLFFMALVNSIREKKWNHLIAVVLCAYLLLTNFAYYMFYAFTGDGYGRWYIVLVPVVIYYACQELDKIKEEKKWVIFSGEFIALALTLLTWIITIRLVDGKDYSPSLDPYYPTKLDYVPYQIVSEGIIHSCLWIVFYQLIAVVVTGMVILFLQHKKYMPKILLGIVAAETILWGNLSFFYMGTWSFEWWNGGVDYRTTATQAGEYFELEDPGFYRTQYDGISQRNSPYIFHTNGTATFHSLYNYDVSQLNLYIHANRPSYERSEDAYGQGYISRSWSAYYGGKLFGTDVALGMKYYAVEREGYGSIEGIADNVPFGSKLVYGNKNTILRYYRNPYVEKMGIGHAVDNVYPRQVNPENEEADFFYSLTNGYSNGGMNEVLRNDEVLLNGAILSDEDYAELVESDSSFGNSLPPVKAKHYQTLGFVGHVYKTNFDWWGPIGEDGYRKGPGYFAHLLDISYKADFEKTELERNSTVVDTNGYRSNDFWYECDKDIVALTPAYGEYFNDNWQGDYFAMHYGSTNNNAKTRIYFIGDQLDEDGVTVKKNVLLSYEYRAIENGINYRIGSSGSSVYGFYPRGRVKYICFNGKPSDYWSTKQVLFPSSSGMVIMRANRTDVENEFNTVTDENHRLSNYTYSKNKFTFESNFQTNKIVTTIVGYDAGWRVKAIDKDGKSSWLKMYKVNGGLVGFLAPKGEMKYEMTYVTPYLKEGVILSSASWFLFAGYSSATFFMKAKKRERELAALEKIEAETSKPEGIEA